MGFLLLLRLHHSSCARAREMDSFVVIVAVAVVVVCECLEKKKRKKIERLYSCNNYAFQRASKRRSKREKVEAFESEERKKKFRFFLACWLLEKCAAKNGQTLESEHKQQQRF